jgi:hypothetical protein
VFGAFVTFNCHESYLRCIDDYRRFSSTFVCCRGVTAVPLLFREQFPLSVSEAPDPADVLWDHVEEPPARRTLRSLRTVVVLALALAVVTVAVSIAVAAAQELRRHVPTPRQCAVDLPSLVFNSYAFPRDAKLSLLPSSVCAKGSYRFTYTSASFASLSAWSPSQPLNAVNGTSCDIGACIAADTTTACSGGPAAWPVVPLALALQCYCRAALAPDTDAHVPDALFDALLQRTSSGVCGTLHHRHAMSLYLALVAPAVLLAVVGPLASLARTLTRSERYMSVSAQTAAVARRVFAVHFLCFCGVLLVAFANLGLLPASDAPSWWRHAPLFTVAEASPDGSGATDRSSWPLFSPHWYVATAPSIVIVVALYVAVRDTCKCVRNCRASRRMRRALVGTAQQRTVDEAFAPSGFSMTSSLGHVCGVVAAAMALGSAVPPLYAVALVAVVNQYWLSKHELLRRARRPPPLPHASVAPLLHALPWLVVLHAIVAVWVFGDDRVLPSLPITDVPVDVADTVDSRLRSYASSSWDVLSVGQRLRRMSAFPFAVIAVVGIVIAVLQLLLALLSRLLSALCTCCPRSSTGSARRRLPMFTGPFAVPVPSQCVCCCSRRRRSAAAAPYVSSSTSTDAPAAPKAASTSPKVHPDPGLGDGAGVVSVRVGGGAGTDTDGRVYISDDVAASRTCAASCGCCKTPALLETRVWTSDGAVDGNRVFTGNAMTTWHVIRETSLTSYDVLVNPMYNVAVSAMTRDAKTMQSLRSAEHVLV